MISEKHQDKYNFIINNALRDVKGNQMNDKIKETDPPIIEQLDDITWMHWNLLHFVEYNNSNPPLQKGGTGYEFFISD